MGSEVTCALSDLRVAAGDRVAVLLLQETHFDPGTSDNWNPVSPLVTGMHLSHGEVRPDEDPGAFIAHIRPWVVPLEAGANQYYDGAVEPASLGWGALEEASSLNRLFLSTVTDFDRRQAADEERPYWKVRRAIEAAGLEADSQFSGPESVHLHAITGAPGVLAANLPGARAGDPLVERIRRAVEPVGYLAHEIPAGAAVRAGSQEQRRIGLLLAPSPASDNHVHFTEADPSDRARARFAVFREDVLDALVPVDGETLRRAAELRELCVRFPNFESVREIMPPDLVDYVFCSELKRIGLFFSFDMASTAQTHIVPLIRATPHDAPVEAFAPWVRLFDLLVATKRIGRALRPAMRYAQAESAAQLDYHRKLAEILDSKGR